MTVRWLPALAALLLGGAGCAAGRSVRRPLPPPPAGESRAGAASSGAGPAPAADRRALPQEERVRRAIQTASALVGRRGVTVDGVDYGPGCAALVRASLTRAGRPPPPEAVDASGLYGFASRHGALRTGRRLQPGDVVFLADRPGGPPAHAGLVARADPDGTAVLVHRVARGIMRLRVNLSWPQRTNDPATGRLINDTLYVGREPIPAGSLVVGVADLLR
jgi:peptidoglycan DL-endopeptidase CwlO